MQSLEVQYFFKYSLILTKDARAFTQFDEIWCNIVHVFNNTAANLRIEYCAFLFGKFENKFIFVTM